MKVTRELVSVLTDPAAAEVHVVLAGWHLTLTAEETSQLANGLVASLERLRSGEKADPIARDAFSVAPAPHSSEEMQQRTRALIQATIREKGLSLREETP